uniref:Uncharacterized protein n=1 Tax=Avena sativa TaxID=4498 RepID=A0ACD5ZPN6_AVESA
MDRRSSSITPRDLECMLCDETAEPKALPLSLLEEITYGFSDEQEIGRGGFAVVYKGKLETMTVAVKRMSNTFMYEKEFHREVECLMMVKHENVVRFLGYCADTQGSMERYEGKFVMAEVQQKLLCFEYLPNGSLHDYITDMYHGLRWRDRYQIITGICQGLHYLHQKNILHLDLKPANILLDDNWVPKITDFGISRCFDQMQSQVITNIAGTPGYLAPESFGHTEVTYRNSYRLDIYSLGVVIIEIVTGKKGYHDVDKVVESWSNMLEKSRSKVQLEQVRVCLEIGIECTNFNPAKRPDTEHIISRLKSRSKVQREPVQIECTNFNPAKRPYSQLIISSPGETESMNGYNEAGVITSQQINPDMLNGSTHAFLLSYQHLHPDIRRCIEYCSIFPKGFKLRLVELVRMWIAQGFVKTSCATEDMEDVAEGYIQELVSCSFLQPMETSSGTDCCTINDVLHDILDKVAPKCFRIENGRWSRSYRREREAWEGDVPRDVQHLFIVNYDAKLITEKILGLENLLTLIVYSSIWPEQVEKEVIESIFKELPELRVLAISFSQEHFLCHDFSVPQSISELRHLRYFTFRTECRRTVILPSTLNKLQHIQFLDFGDCDNVEFNFADLINLCHLSCGSQVKLSNICKLTSLQTLPSGFEVRNEHGYELKQLRNLNKLCGRLEIIGLGNARSKEEAVEANLASKERITELVLSWDEDGDTRCNSPEVEAEVLEGLCPPVGLETLNVRDYEGSRYPDWMVGKQNGGPRNLQQLVFMRCGQLGGLAPPLVEAFPQLRVLQLWLCSWDALPCNLEHLTSLKELFIDGCLNIRSLPALPQSLEEFRLDGCNAELTKSCLTVGHPYWQKVEHIPKKYIG